MIKNSELFFIKAKDFQNKRKEIMDTYETRAAQLEDARGSKYFTDEMKKATDARDAALSELKSEYRESFRIALDGMSKANGSRGTTPPTDEQLRLLQVLQMRGVVDEPQRAAFQKDLDRAANTCADNAMCISVLNDIARKNGFLRGYHSTAKEMSVDDADRMIKDLQAALPDFMEHDTKRAARIAAEHNARLYGTTGNERPLPKRELFDSKADCYAEFSHGMLSGDALTAFCAAVDGE